MIGRSYVPLIEHCPHIQDVIPYDKRFNTEDLMGFLKFAWQIRSRKFDLVLNLQNTRRYDILGALSGAKYRSSIIHLDHPTDGVTGVYRILNTVGIRDKNVPFEFWPGPDDRKFAADFLQNAGVHPDDVIVGINPGTERPTKQWPWKNYALLGDIIHRAGMKVVVFGCPEDIKREEAVARDMHHRPFIASGRFSLMQAMCIAERCNAFVSNDSGLMHFAGLVGVPTVGIFGSTNPSYDGPVGPNSRAIYQAVDCSPCYEKECTSTHGTLSCLTGISPDKVFQLLNDVIQLKG